MFINEILYLKCCMSKKDLLVEDESQYIQEAFEKKLAFSIEEESFEEARNIIAEAHIADLAAFLNRATSNQKVKVLSLLAEERVSDLIIELDVTVIESIIEIIGDDRSAKILDELDIDDAIYVLDALDEEDIKYSIIKLLKAKKQKELKEGLSYPEGSAGRLMQKEFISVPENWTIAQTIKYIQEKQDKGDIPEVFYEVFVTNSKLIPIGSIPLSILVIKPENLAVKEVMQIELKLVQTHLDEEDVSYLFKKYSLVTVPVVNKNNRLVGVITLGDAMEVIDKHAEENIMHMGGIIEDDIHLNIIEVIKGRFPWLLISLITATICSLVVNFFHDTIQQAVILSAIMPIVSGISGNAGTQTMTVTVLSLSSKDLTALNITRVIMKQIISCSCNGFILAIFGGLILGVLHNNATLSFIFGLAVTFNFALAGFLGSIIPIMLNRTGFDPAIASPVFVTTLIDILSFAIFLSLATKLLI